MILNDLMLFGIWWVKVKKFDNVCGTFRCWSPDSSCNNNTRVWNNHMCVLLVETCQDAADITHVWPLTSSLSVWERRWEGTPWELPSGSGGQMCQVYMFQMCWTSCQSSRRSWSRAQVSLCRIELNVKKWRSDNYWGGTNPQDVSRSEGSSFRDPQRHYSFTLCERGETRTIVLTHSEFYMMQNNKDRIKWFISFYFTYTS